MFGNKSKPQNRIDSLIGADTVVEGNIQFAGGLRIDGRVRGNVVAGDEHGMLVISEQAVVDGEVRVRHVVVNGVINGPVYAAESLELQPKAKVTGDVHYKKLEMQLGALVQGRLAYVADAQSEKIVRLKPAASE